MKAYAPNGKLILATLETIPGLAIIADDGWFRLADGTIDFDYSGTTDVDWDNQRTVEKDGQRVFLDDDYNEWTENQLVLKDEEEEEPATEVAPEPNLKEMVHSLLPFAHSRAEDLEEIAKEAINEFTANSHQAFDARRDADEAWAIVEAAEKLK